MQRPKVKEAKPRRPTSGAERGTKTKRAPRQARRLGSHTKETHRQQAPDPKAPILSPCSLFGPDGKERPGWELRVGDVLFGRADSKESLLAYYARLHEPMPTGHWRERSWQPQRRTVRRVRPDDTGQEEQSDEYELELEPDTLEAWD
ncbi:MAG: hypothetical protein AB1671_13460 [Thermodesulfobacteriota bacterium]|jgi:hypothetical protein